jgi:hypothetical protein
MKIFDFIVCDDIRFEINNKNTLIGIYDDLNFNVDKLSLDQWPKAMKLGFFVRIKLEPSDEIDEFQLEFFLNEKEISKARGLINNPIEKSLLLNIALVNNNFIIPNKGIISFKLKFFNSKKLVCELEPDYKLKVDVTEVQMG